MINAKNAPINFSSRDDEFTTERYKQLLREALEKYRFVDYQSIPWGQNFVLWRHDCDFSLNRALALAKIESDFGIKSTYFVNPHSEFYNLLEQNQSHLISEILKLGHDVALHFDAAFYDTSSESDLNKQVNQEADLLERYLGVRPATFSFHNPTAFHLSCEAEYYGGLLNCYSRRFKTEVPYCSDSNGYWRFRSLTSVLTDGDNQCLQILTHPDWWQERSMPPRRRIFRSVYGRANASMSLYDKILAEGGRENLSGKSLAIRFLKQSHPKIFHLLDYLWNTEEYQALFVELWRLHEKQINKLCKAELRKQWQVPAAEVNTFFESPSLAIDGWRLFAGVFGKTWQGVVGLDDSGYQAWVELRNTLIHGRASAPGQRLEDGCVFLCSAILSLAEWGKAQPIQFDGIAHLGSIGIPTYKTAEGSLTDRLEEVADEIPNFPNKKWALFKAEMSKVGAGEMAQGAEL